MTRTKLQKILNKLDGKSEATFKVIADFDASVKVMRDKLEQDIIPIATLNEIRTEVSNLRKKIDINPLLEATETLKNQFKQNALDTLKEIEDRTAELRKVIDEGNRNMEEKTDTIAKNVATINEKVEKVSGETSTQIKQVITKVEEVSGKLLTFADKKDIDEKIRKLEEKDNTEELKDYTDKTRAELMNLLAQKGGGNMNRNIAVGGNTSVLSKFTDLNIRPGTNVTLTYTNNNTTKYTDLTIAATGGAGTSRSISTVAVSSVIADTAATDIVVIASAGIQLTLPTAVGNTNLYTLKNIAASSIFVGTTGGQTIDSDTNLILATQYTAVDLISDNANWHIT